VAGLYEVCLVGDQKLCCIAFQSSNSLMNAVSLSSSVKRRNMSGLSYSFSPSALSALR